MGLTDHIAAVLDERTLEAVQAAHARRFQASGLPTPRLENWKYTALRALEAIDYGAATSTGSPTPDWKGLVALGAAKLDAWRVVLDQGITATVPGDSGGLPEGCTLTALSAKDLRPDWAEDALARQFEAPDESLAALNGALCEDGWVLSVDEGVELDRPIQVIHLARNGRPMSHARLLVRMAPGSRARIVEQYLSSAGTEALVNDVTQAWLGAGSELQWIRLQQLADETCLITRTLVDQAEDSCLIFHGVDLGGRLVRHDLLIDLNGKGADCQLHGIYALDGRRHLDNHLRVDHRSPGATSHEFYKGVLDDKARAVFNGKVVVHPGADGTDATQTNGNLLLSRTAEIDTKPELEIYADDVKCAHGATVGQLDPAQLFYLRSRGLPEAEARALLTEAFCRAVVDTLDDPALREFVAQRVAEHLPRQGSMESQDESR